MNRWTRSALAWLVPTTCRLCGAQAGGAVLCSGCKASLAGDTPAGPVQGCSYPPGAADTPFEPGRGTPAYLDRVVWALEYDAGTRRLVHDLKFRGGLPIATVLGERLLEAVRRWGEGDASLLIPVPLHGFRLLRRGFNQSREIARPLARALRIPLARPGLCRRVRATAPQSVLDGVAARRRNLAGAFRAQGSLAGIHAVIVDDVLTTGSTVSELARVLRRHGAPRVQAWVVCRAGDPRTM